MVEDKYFVRRILKLIKYKGNKAYKFDNNRCDVNSYYKVNIYLTKKIL